MIWWIVLILNCEVEYTICELDLWIKAFHHADAQIQHKSNILWVLKADITVHLHDSNYNPLDDSFPYGMTLCQKKQTNTRPTPFPCYLYYKNRNLWASSDPSTSFYL